MFGTALSPFAFLSAGDAWPVGVIVLGAVLLLLVYVFARRDLHHLAINRSALYAGSLALLVLAHQLVFQDVSADLPEGWRAPLVFLEGAALAILILALPPLRHRAAEALRYLMGAWIAPRRERLQKLATQISAQAGRPPTELVGWFGTALRQ